MTQASMLYHLHLLSMKFEQGILNWPTQNIYNINPSNLILMQVFVKNFLISDKKLKLFYLFTANQTGREGKIEGELQTRQEEKVK